MVTKIGFFLVWMVTKIGFFWYGIQFFFLIKYCTSSNVSKMSILNWWIVQTTPVWTGCVVHNQHHNCSSLNFQTWRKLLHGYDGRVGNELNYTTQLLPLLCWQTCNHSWEGLVSSISTPWPPPWSSLIWKDAHHLLKFVGKFRTCQCISLVFYPANTHVRLVFPFSQPCSQKINVLRTPDQNAQDELFNSYSFSCAGSPCSIISCKSHHSIVSTFKLLLLHSIAFSFWFHRQKGEKLFFDLNSMWTQDARCRKKHSICLVQSK
jgi:hypothetical protein